MAGEELAQGQERVAKTRAACDECRQKKLKCSGEHPNCSRCRREGIKCIYSPQKQMGRPKKRQRQDDYEGETAQAGASANTGAAGPELVWDSRKRSYGPSDTATGFPVPGGLDMNAFDQAFTPGGRLQPWVQPNGGAWDFLVGDASIVPGLTPDTSEHSPPTIGRSIETSQNTSHRDISTQLLLDPALAPPSQLTNGSNLGLPNSLPSCACLSTIYLTLNTLTSMDAGYKFPYALHPLRDAMQTASDIIDCEQCPQRFITALQNTQLLGTLLMSIAERFGKVLDSISTESIRADLVGENKKFRLADLSQGNSHLHTGGLGCAAAFSIDLSPKEWRTMCKKVVRAEIDGPSRSDREDGHHKCPYFKGVLQKMRDRQQAWHSSQKKLPDDFPRDSNGLPIGGPRDHATHDVSGSEHLCLRMVNMADQLVGNINWS
ncbi:hypothetical protein K431DRAFT_232414 [Polychaeton citri CBS 116435]|uniref:Zn(2)-C6 fungal-type domain-containing protein n=1 Tax=Polychaeton citri CBS 116435 TaxID=1314669 RepID=A0A9P4Q491_9PEZI|nr:hypothetical protein K431DRAFT_232414 [Polychaeton citri CBS 116435]